MLLLCLSKEISCFPNYGNHKLCQPGPQSRFLSLSFLYLLRHDSVLLLKNISQLLQPPILVWQVGIQLHYCFFHQWNIWKVHKEMEINGSQGTLILILKQQREKETEKEIWGFNFTSPFPQVLPEGLLSIHRELWLALPNQKALQFNSAAHFWPRAIPSHQRSLQLCQKEQPRADQIQVAWGDTPGQHTVTLSDNHSIWVTRETRAPEDKLNTAPMSKLLQFMTAIQGQQHFPTPMTDLVRTHRRHNKHELIFHPSFPSKD